MKKTRELLVRDNHHAFVTRVSSVCTYDDIPDDSFSSELNNDVISDWAHMYWATGALFFERWPSRFAASSSTSFVNGISQYWFGQLTYQEFKRATAGTDNLRDWQRLCRLEALHGE